MLLHLLLCWTIWSTVWPSASVALKVKLYVVPVVGDGAVPVIAPVLEFKVKFIVAAGVLAFDVNTDVVSLNATVLSDEASTSNDTDAPAAIVPKDPADVENEGAVEAVMILFVLRPANPSGFSILTK